MASTTNHGACMCIESVQLQKGATQDNNLGCAPPVRSSSTSAFFFCSGAAILSRSSSSSQLGQHQYRASPTACSSSNRSKAATAMTGRCYSSKTTYRPVPGTYLWYNSIKIQSIVLLYYSFSSSCVFYPFIQITLSGNVINILVII